MKNNNLYTVYIHVCKVNCKKYIGITSKKPEYRWCNGLGYKSNPYFYSAICKYGWDEGFDHIIVATQLTKEEAEQMEIELILKHNATNREFGYNIHHGGGCKGSHSDETKRKISEKQKSIKRFSSGMKGKHHSDDTKAKIGATHRGSNSYHARKILQIDIDTNEPINEWLCLADASNSLGISRASICMVCQSKRKTAGGFKWMYSEDYVEEIEEKHGK